MSTLKTEAPVDWKFTSTRSAGLLRPGRWVVVVLAVALLQMVVPAWAQFDVAEPAAKDGAATKKADDTPGIFLQEPTTPDEMFDAVVVTVDLARFQLAAKYLQKFIDQQPDDETIVRLRQKYGPVLFLRLTNIDELKPRADELLERVNKVYRDWDNNPQRIDALIAELEGTPREREAALQHLRGIGAAVVPRLLVIWSKPSVGRQRDLLLYTLTRLGEEAVSPLLGAVESPNVELRAVSIEALGWLGSDRAIPYLWYPAFAPNQPTSVQISARGALARILHVTPQQAVEQSTAGVTQRLYQAALEHFRGESAWKVGEDGKVALWGWIDTKNTVGITLMTREEASLFVGTRLIRQALELSPENSQFQTLYLAFLLANAVHEVGWEHPLPTGPGTAHDTALLAGDQLVNEVLAFSIENGNTGAVLAAVKVLGQIGTRHLLSVRREQQSPLGSALNYPDPRIQFAAASTILQLDPPTSFRGSQRVVEILQRALLDSGSPQAVVIDANIKRGQQVGAFANDLGFEPQVVQTGQEGFRAAAERSDVQLVLVHANVIRWELSQTIANFRADARTENLPIVIFGPDYVRPKLEHLLQTTKLTSFAIESSSSDNFILQVRPFLQSIRTPALTSEQRGQQREMAVLWFAHLSQGNRTETFDFSSAEPALYALVDQPKLAQSALFAIGAVASRQAQQHLQEVAINPRYDMQTRETAALQLAFHLQRFGLLLSSAEVEKVRQAWQMSSEPALKTALASVLGSLKPNARLVGERLKEFPLPTLDKP